MNKSDQSNLVLEGPILISTTAVLGSDVMNRLQGKIKEAVEKGCLTNEESTKVLILSGSHGNEDGHSALSDITQLKDLNDTDEGSVTTTFYENDCQRQEFLNFLSCTKNHYNFFLVPKIFFNYLCSSDFFLRMYPQLGFFLKS